MIPERRSPCSPAPGWAPALGRLRGFSPDSLRDRINDSASKVVVTSDGGWRRGSVVPLKANTDEALREAPSVAKVVVVRRTGNDVAMAPGATSGGTTS